jgi:ABC-2 type transport system ATP-binding protein
MLQAGFGGAALFGTKIHLPSKVPDQDEARLRTVLSRAAVEVRGVAIRPQTLEDVFVHRVMALERREREATIEVA